MNAGTCAGLIDSQIDTISWQVPNDQCDGFIWVGQELHEWKSGFLGQLANAELNRVIENRVHVLREMGVVDEARTAVASCLNIGEDDAVRSSVLHREVSIAGPPAPLTMAMTSSQVSTSALCAASSSAVQLRPWVAHASSQLWSASPRYQSPLGAVSQSVTYVT